VTTGGHGRRDDAGVGRGGGGERGGADGPGTTLVDVQMIGAAGRIYTSRSRKDVVTVRDRISSVLKSIEGREH
jgi:hypothetical protein